jgi:hypothetical protein
MKSREAHTDNPDHDRLLSTGKNKEIIKSHATIRCSQILTQTGEKAEHVSSIFNNWYESFVFHWHYTQHSVLFNNTVNCWDYSSYTVIDECMGMQHWWYETDGEKLAFSEKKTYSRPTTSIMNLTWTGLELNPVLRGDGLATNRLRHGMAPHIMTEVLYVSTEEYWPHITYLIYASKSYCNKVVKYKRRLFRACQTSFCSLYGRLVCLCSELIWTVNM